MFSGLTEEMRKGLQERIEQGETLVNQDEVGKDADEDQVCGCPCGSQLNHRQAQTLAAVVLVILKCATRVDIYLFVGRGIPPACTCRRLMINP